MTPNLPRCLFSKKCFLLLFVAFVWSPTRATPDIARATPTPARRRRERRTRSFFRHVQMAVHMVVVSAQHHSAQRCCSIATQTDDYGTASATFFNMSDGDDSDEPAAPMTEYVAPALDVTCTAPAPVIEYVPAGTYTELVPVIEPDDTYAAPKTEHVAPITFATPAPVVKKRGSRTCCHISSRERCISARGWTCGAHCSTPAPETDYVTHPLVMDYIEHAPPVDFDTPSQMLLFAHIMAAVTTGVGLDTASVVFEPPRKKQGIEYDFSQLAAELDASSRDLEQSVADLKASVDLMNMSEQTNLIQSADAASSILVPTLATHEVVTYHDLDLRGFRRGDDVFGKDSQANLSQLRLELREFAKWADITRKCASNGKPSNVREAVHARQRFDEKKAEIDALTSRKRHSAHDHWAVDRVRVGTFFFFTFHWCISHRNPRHESVGKDGSSFVFLLFLSVPCLDDDSLAFSIPFRWMSLCFELTISPGAFCVCVLHFVSQLWRPDCIDLSTIRVKKKMTLNLPAAGNWRDESSISACGGGDIQFGRSKLHFHNMQISDHRYREKVFKNLLKKLNLAGDAPVIGIEALKTNVLIWETIFVGYDEGRHSSWTKLRWKSGSAQEHELRGISEFIRYHSEVDIGLSVRDSECDNDWLDTSFMDEIWILSRSCDHVDESKSSRLLRCPSYAGRKWQIIQMRVGNGKTR